MPGRSAVIVRIVLPVQLASIRDAGDRMAARGVPAHVTVLFPFLAVADLAPAVRSALARVAADQAPFDARFSRVERREQMVWLLPEDQERFRELTDSVATMWPDHPPYGGIHDTVIPHLTLLETTDGPALDAAWSTAVEAGPFVVAVRELTVITESTLGRWRTRWRLPMGDGYLRKSGACPGAASVRKTTGASGLRCPGRATQAPARTTRCLPSSVARGRPAHG